MPNVAIVAITVMPITSIQTIVTTLDHDQPHHNDHHLCWWSAGF